MFTDNSIVIISKELFKSDVQYSSQIAFEEVSPDVTRVRNKTIRQTVTSFSDKQHIKSPELNAVRMGSKIRKK